MCGKGLRFRKSSARVVHMEATNTTYARSNQHITTRLEGITKLTRAIGRGRRPSDRVRGWAYDDGSALVRAFPEWGCKTPETADDLLAIVAAAKAHLAAA